MEMGTPAGKPVNVATRHSPCDSPAVSNLSMRNGNFYGTNNRRLPMPLAAKDCVRG